MASGQPIITGYLKKKSPKGIGGMKAWQKRYFCLYENVLTYGKSDKQERAQGMSLQSLLIYTGSLSFSVFQCIHGQS